MSSAILGIRLSMLIGGEGVPNAAPPEICEALQSVHVNHGDFGRSGFQLTFQIGRGLADLVDYRLVTHQSLQPFNRVILIVLFGMRPQVLMDGFITNHQLTPSNDPGASTLTITGEDVSVMMDMYERVEEYPNQNDDEIVKRIIDSYQSKVHLKPEVWAPPSVPSSVPSFPVWAPNPFETGRGESIWRPSPFETGSSESLEGGQVSSAPSGPSIAPSSSEKVSTQHETDLGYIQFLAQRHGYVFYITPGPAPRMNTAYWGPPKGLQVPQRALSVNMGPHSTVESISFHYDGQAPYQVAFRLADGTEATVEQSAGEQSLAGRPAPLKRTIYASDTGGADLAQATAQFQARVNQSVRDTVTASGELDTLRYGRLLQPWGLVDLRGAGLSYDGTYFVKSVSHRINIRNGEYKQSFTLTREGLGATSPVVRV